LNDLLQPPSIHVPSRDLSRRGRSIGNFKPTWRRQDYSWNRAGVIGFFALKSLKAKAIHAEPEPVHDRDACKLFTLTKSRLRFLQGRTTLFDGPTSGRPQLLTNETISPKRSGLCLRKSRSRRARSSVGTSELRRQHVYRYLMTSCGCKSSIFNGSRMHCPRISRVHGSLIRISFSRCSRTSRELVSNESSLATSPGSFHTPFMIRPGQHLEMSFQKE
jgi:hypothetical protein